MVKKRNRKKIKNPRLHFHWFPQEKQKGGGVGILVPNRLQHRERKDLTLDIPGFENITLEIKTHNKSIIVSSLYRPPNCKEREFLKNYKRWMKKFSIEERRKLIVGMDHNLDLIKSDKHKPTKEFIEINLEHELIPTITKQTRITRNSASLIDNIIIGRNYHSVYSSMVSLTDLSDHCPTMLEMPNIDIYKTEPKKIYTRRLNPLYIKKINDRLQETDWETILESVDTENSNSVYQKTINNILNEISPVKEYTINPNKALKEQWMTPGLMKCTMKQRNLYKRTLRESSNDIDHEKYKQYRNCLKQVLRRTKQEYYKEKCVEFKRNTSKLWKMVNTIISKHNDKSNIIEYLKIGNVEIYNAKEIANQFGKYFSTVGEDYANKVPTSHKSSHHYTQKIPRNPSTIFLIPTNKIEIENLIRSLPNKIRSGHDEIINILLKKLAPNISLPLSVIFNKSLKEGAFPSTMKLADLVPLYKSKEKYYTTNYRPISILLTTSKLLEKIIYTRVYTFLTDHQQLYQSQYGFRTNHSCENAICELVGSIVISQELKHYTIGLFLDLSKAFDTLDHKILLQKLERYGIRGKALEWFKSYLSSRKMRYKCRIESSNKLEYSDYYNSNYGTPQGSCLGPLLFILFTNDLHLNIVHSSSILFADDTTLYNSHRNLEYLK